MKKITLLFAALVAGAFSFNASAVNNPEGSDGNLTYIYSCGGADFDVANPSTNFESDQRITLAVDLTDDQSGILTWLNTPEAGITRSVAFHMWLAADITADVRTRHIAGNIWGVDFSMAQLFGANFPAAGTTVGGALAQVGSDGPAIVDGQVECFFIPCGYSFTTATGDGSAWWVSAGGQQNLKTAVYTGTNTAAPFASVATDLGFNGEMAGIALPCSGTNGIADVNADGAVAVAFYTILGAELSKEPEAGIFIVKYSDGTSAKIVK